MFKKKPTASEVDGVQYRRAKLWQIICYACNGLVGMSVYSLIGMASYSASIGYGITTAAVGIILTCSRILDGITDPLLAFVYDRVNTKFGKLRILMVAGFLIEALALYGMFTGFSSKGLGLPVFALLYIVYIIGYTITNMTAQTIPAIMTNDPRQRPTIGVWTTVFNYMVPMAMSMVLNVADALGLTQQALFGQDDVQHLIAGGSVGVVHPGRLLGLVKALRCGFVGLQAAQVGDLNLELMALAVDDLHVLPCDLVLLALAVIQKVQCVHLLLHGRFFEKLGL